MTVASQILKLRREVADLTADAGARTAADGPLFVIGSPRSGTSDLASALARHPRFWAGGDAHLFYSLIGPNAHGRSKLLDAYAAGGTSEAGFMTANGVTYPEYARFVGWGFDRLFRSRSRGRRWIDSAAENTLVAEDLSFMFPAARFVHVVRDGRAVVRSARSSSWTIGWAATVKSACELWAHFANVGIAFRDRHPERVLEVRIEDVARAPEEACERILDFLGAERSAEPARGIRENGLSSSYEPPREGCGMFDVPEDGDWARWEPEERAEFVAIAGDALRALGYAAP